MTTTVRSLIIANLVLMATVIGLVFVALAPNADAAPAGKVRASFATIEFLSSVDCDKQDYRVKKSNRSSATTYLTSNEALATFRPFPLVADVSSSTTRIQTGPNSWNTTDVVTTVTPKKARVGTSTINACRIDVVAGLY